MNQTINIYYLFFSNIFLKRERERERLTWGHFYAFARVIYIIISFFQKYSHINHTSLLKYPEKGKQLFVSFSRYFALFNHTSRCGLR